MSSLSRDIGGFRLRSSLMSWLMPGRRWVMSHLSTIPLGIHPTGYPPIYRGLGCLPTGSCPALFLAVSASLVSNP